MLTSTDLKNKQVADLAEGRDLLRQIRQARAELLLQIQDKYDKNLDPKDLQDERYKLQLAYRDIIAQSQKLAGKKAKGDA